ncbi:DUF2156 domain-containing protein [Deinococcus detaillensis]|uniref:DUF2156 domain-containing protein n=1 Tax=Deinococcus detaillensis TaxID=2592048 RepID=A0A553V478_9DEIO|nr:phosphatidylglycerol lysyltransferase domain-containing protein [Deinococcus detaillensis]TSA87300.1 DUF2156 domain-containing protein [Deinococcus detaillensis]
MLTRFRQPQSQALLPAPAFQGRPACPAPNAEVRWQWHQQFGYNPSSLGALSAEIFEQLGIAGGLPYHAAGRVWIGTGDPLCEPEEQTELLRAFVAQARRAGKVAILLPVTARLAAVAAPLGFTAVCLGATPYLELQSWSPAGNSGKMLRGNLNAARRLGVKLESAPLDGTELTPAFRAECAALMGAWQTSRRAGTPLSWVFELDPFGWSAGKRYFLARDAGGQAVVFLAASPLPARGGWYLEDLIRHPNAPSGAAAALTAYALAQLRESGASLATLGAVPLCLPRRPEPQAASSAVLETLLYAARPLLSRWYNFDGLRQFKNQFRPSFWENEYLLLPSKSALPSAALGLLRATLPGGLRTLG